MNRLVIIVILIFSGIAGLSLSWYVHHPAVMFAKKQEKSERVFHHPLSFLQTLKHDPHAGEKIYREYCRSCHGREPIISIHAPRIEDERAWKQYQSWTMQKLLNTVNEGGKGMPARGGCFECSDDLLEQAILYMRYRGEKTNDFSQKSAQKRAGVNKW